VARKEARGIRPECELCAPPAIILNSSVHSVCNFSWNSNNGRSGANASCGRIERLWSSASSCPPSSLEGQPRCTGAGGCRGASRDCRPQRRAEFVLGIAEVDLVALPEGQSSGVTVVTVVDALGEDQVREHRRQRVGRLSMMNI
jgi:hypothetical protein